MTAQTYECIRCGLEYEPNEFTREDEIYTFDEGEVEEQWYVETTCQACTELARIRLADTKKEVERQRQFAPYYKAVGYGIVGLFLFFIFVYQWIPGAPGVGY